jgi:hypothetical protein
MLRVLGQYCGSTALANSKVWNEYSGALRISGMPE